MRINSFKKKKKKREVSDPRFLSLNQEVNYSCSFHLWGHISPEKCTALRIPLKNTLFSTRKHFLQDQALFWQHQILSCFFTLFKLTLQETEACDKTLIPSQHSFFSSPSLSLFLLDLIKTRTVLCTAMWEGCGHTSSLNFVLFLAFKLVSHRTDIHFYSCSLLATCYSWCLPNARLTHCPQCMWKARGQKSRFAAWLHLFVNSVRAQCPPNAASGTVVLGTCRLAPAAVSLSDA